MIVTWLHQADIGGSCQLLHAEAVDQPLDANLDRPAVIVVAEADPAGKVELPHRSCGIAKVVGDPAKCEVQLQARLRMQIRPDPSL